MNRMARVQSRVLNCKETREGGCLVVTMTIVTMIPLPAVRAMRAHHRPWLGTVVPMTVDLVICYRMDREVESGQGSNGETLCRPFWIPPTPERASLWTKIHACAAWRRVRAASSTPRGETHPHDTCGG